MTPASKNLVDLGHRSIINAIGQALVPISMIRHVHHSDQICRGFVEGAQNFVSDCKGSKRFCFTVFGLGEGVGRYIAKVPAKLDTILGMIKAAAESAYSLHLSPMITEMT